MAEAGSAPDWVPQAPPKIEASAEDSEAAEEGAETAAGAEAEAGSA